MWGGVCGYMRKRACECVVRSFSCVHVSVWVWCVSECVGVVCE